MFDPTAPKAMIIQPGLPDASRVIRPRTRGTAPRFPAEKRYTLERVEAETWSDLYRAATVDDAVLGGLHLATIGTATVMSAAHFDVLFFNRVLGLGLDAAADDAVLDKIIARYTEAGVPRFFVQLSNAAQPASLPDRLYARGFVHHNNWMKLYRDVTPPPAADTDLRVEPIDPADAARFGAIAAPAFGWPPIVEPWLSRLVGRAGWHCYFAYDGDTPVAIGGLYVCGDYGYLGPTATLPDFRRRGAQRALLARRIRDAAALGCRTLVTETAEDRPGHPAPSFRNLIRYGFQVAYARPNYLYHPVRAGFESAPTRLH